MNSIYFSYGQQMFKPPDSFLGRERDPGTPEKETTALAIGRVTAGLQKSLVATESQGERTG